MKQEHIANSDDNELSLVPDPFLAVSCPFLGVHNDPGTPMGFATPGNQCYAFEPALNVDLEKQRAHCLSDCYSECLYFQQQMAETPAEDGGLWASGPLRRIVNGRTLAVMMMLLLILLAVLIWWPPPGTSMEEGTVFGVSFSLNSPNVESEGADTAGQQVVPQEKSREEALPAAGVEDGTEDVQQPDSVFDTNKKDDEAKRSAPLAQNSTQGATLNSPTVDEALSVDGVDAVLAESGSSVAVQISPPEPEKVIEAESSAAPATTAVEKKPVIEERAEKSEDEEETASEVASSDLPDQDQGDQPPVAESADSSRKKGTFNPIAYGDQGSDSETLNVYQYPLAGSGHYEKIARPELVSLLGRDNTAEWIKIRTESGIEGWVLVSETDLGSWTKSLPEIEPH